MRLLKQIESVKTKDSWLERCEVSRIKSKSATKDQIRTALDHGVSTNKLTIVNDDLRYIRLLPTAHGDPDWAQADGRRLHDHTRL